MSETVCYFHDEGALLERLVKGLKRRFQEVVFLVGSPLSAPCSPGVPGVPGVAGVIDLIRREFADDANQLAQLDKKLESAGSNRYQEAFVFLQGRRGQQTANEIIRDAVLKAWTGQPPRIDNQPNPDDACREIELNVHGWALAPGIEALGKLIAAYPTGFGKSILTTNFDPLLEISIRRADGLHFRTTLHADGNLAQTEAPGCHVIHLHGYWYGSDTLHTPRQLSQPRPRLRASLSALLRNKLVIVCGYGGWDDVFTEALMDVVRDDAASPEIIWTFYAAKPDIGDTLSDRIAPGMDRGRVTLYSGIDCNQFFPKLYDTWSTLDPPTNPGIPKRSNLVHVTQAMAKEVLAKPTAKTVLEGDDEDRPPLIDICVGRDDELQRIKDSQAKVIFVTGIGGQGKSTLAAKYYTDCQSTQSHFSLFVWRDCKEESERFETQLAAVIEKLSEGKISGKDLAQQSVESVIDLLLTHIRGIDVLFVFDNVDHYVDIDKRRMLGSADMFIATLLKASATSQVIFTCRPWIDYNAPTALSVRLGGIDLGASLSLFDARKAKSNTRDVEAAHRLTEGHAFWLDLLAIQAAQGKDLNTLLSDIGAGVGTLPATTLNSIWSTLKDRERVVLRLMAETVKPESDVEIASYLSGSYTFQKVAKALRVLRSLNLIVIKRRPNGKDLLELHPLVRNFIRQSFPEPERASYINRIIRVYKGAIGKFKYQLTERPPLSILQYWTQSAELNIALGNTDDAFATLMEVASAFLLSAYPRELARVTRRLFSSIDWVAEHENIKGFEPVFRSHIRTLTQLGQTEEVDTLLDKYERTVPNRDVRYINYCELRSYSLWFRAAFVDAVEWARRGAKLFEESGVDSKFSNIITYMLALAERDSGRPELALTTFLDGRSLAEVIDPDELDENRGEQHYGNVGRCLHFMGQIESALVCYQKAALLIERSSASGHVLNKGYARMWIGELLSGREELPLAYAFLRSAFRFWEQVAPPKASPVRGLIKEIEARAGGALPVKDNEVERVCLDWILGRDSEIGSGESRTHWR